jgi:hypothetical protein
MDNVTAIIALLRKQAAQTERISETKRAHPRIRIGGEGFPRQPCRAGLNISPGLGVIISQVVVVEAGLG